MPDPSHVHGDASEATPGTSGHPQPAQELSGPCKCWIQTHPTGHANHCCFGYPDPNGDLYQRGQTPPCGHWDERIERPA